MNHEKFKSTVGFTDLLFNILVGFAFLFIVAFLLIKPEAKKTWDKFLDTIQTAFTSDPVQKYLKDYELSI